MNEPTHLKLPKTVYIDDDTLGTGSDETGTGTMEKPFLTEARAVKELPDGSGIVRDIHSRLVYCRRKPSATDEWSEPG